MDRQQQFPPCPWGIQGTRRAHRGRMGWIASEKGSQSAGRIPVAWRFPDAFYVGTRQMLWGNIKMQYSWMGCTANGGVRLWTPQIPLSTYKKGFSMARMWTGITLALDDREILHWWNFEDVGVVHGLSPIYITFSRERGSNLFLVWYLKGKMSLSTHQNWLSCQSSPNASLKSATLIIGFSWWL